MSEAKPAHRYRFGVFEADAATGQLRKNGLRIKLHAQPFQVLLMLLGRPGELLTREEIAEELWPGGTFVDFEHGLNSAMNRIRDALGDSASNPRFIQTLPRQGYKFVAPVECDNDANSPRSSWPLPNPELEPGAEQGGKRKENGSLFGLFLASPHELPRISFPLARRLFLLFQLMYLSIYIAALANLPEIEDLLSPLPRATEVSIFLVTSAAILIPTRAFVFCTVLLRAPQAGGRFLTIWKFLLPLDILWSLSPLLLLHHISFGAAVPCVALLVYSPFVQRSLALMGATG